MDLSLSHDSDVNAFIELGKVLGRAAESIKSPESGFKEEFPAFYDSLQVAGHYNAWFTAGNISFALNEWKDALTAESLSAWLNVYQAEMHLNNPKRVAVIMAGNIPLVGFHDFICTLLSGHTFIGKLSSDDKILLPAIAELLCSIEPGFSDRIEFTEGTISDFDAVIATGSNNTSRYFEYYFAKYPHIIRKNRNGVAVLSGNESDDELLKLGSDICTYFGLGCRNVSKVFIPAGYDPIKLFTAVAPYHDVFSAHNKYMNNYSYHRAVYLLNNIPHLDNNAIILNESELYSSPIPVIYYQYYYNIEVLKEKLDKDDELIQCIVTDAFTNDKTVAPGHTQRPGLHDYADGIDTMKFLLNL